MKFTKRPRKRQLCLALLLSCLAIPAEAQSGWGRWAWSQASPPQVPAGNKDFAMVYDSGRSACVMLGGRGSGTLAWNGSTWSAIAPDIQRHAPAAAYDESTGNIVLFSGQSTVTITLDPNTYVLTPQGTWVNTNTFGPARRYFANMTYDSVRGKVLLFGGQSQGGAPIIFGDFWQWDQTSGWQQLTPPVLPPARESAGFVFDSDRGVAVLYGGRDASGSRDDTWEWNGSAWTQINAAVKPPRLDSHVMVYDRLRQSTLLYGGITFLSGTNDQTWELPSGSNAWVRFPGTTPAARFGGAAAYDAGRATTVMFGGQVFSSGSSETWEFAHPAPATYAAVGTGCGGAVLGSFPGRMGLPWLGGVFVTSLSGLPANKAYFMTLGTSDTLWSGIPLPLSLGFIGLPSCFVNSSIDLTLGPFSYTGTTSTWAVAIPPGLPVGSSFFNQALVFDPPSGLFVSTTNSGKATLAVY